MTPFVKYGDSGAFTSCKRRPLLLNRVIQGHLRPVDYDLWDKYRFTSCKRQPLLLNRVIQGHLRPVDYDLWDKHRFTSCKRRPLLSIRWFSGNHVPQTTTFRRNVGFESMTILLHPPLFTMLDLVRINAIVLRPTCVSSACGVSTIYKLPIYLSLVINQ